jgi:hypothetical protein
VESDFPRSFPQNVLGKRFFETFSAENSKFSPTFLVEKFPRNFPRNFPRKKMYKKSAPEDEIVLEIEIFDAFRGRFKKTGFSAYRKSK